MKQTAKPQTSDSMIRHNVAGLLVLLVVQFIVGMYLNFYTELPDSHPGTSGSFAPSIPWVLANHAGLALVIHVIVWILLTVGGIAVLVRAILSRRKAYIVGSSVGFLFILMAGSGGLSFLNRGGADKDSFMMAIGFIVALVAYGVTFYKTSSK
ncbi:MAG TPA: hypothetical protein VLH86_01235 [Patescibacteria group bacterium]|nr:hypothetical protein [Patescibacteria group bacterium]